VIDSSVLSPRYERFSASPARTALKNSQLAPQLRHEWNLDSINREQRAFGGGIRMCEAADAARKEWPISWLCAVTSEATVPRRATTSPSGVLGSVSPMIWRRVL
jgi:hypothetical protein